MIKIRFKKRIKSFATKGEKVKKEKGREKFDLAFDGYSNNLNEIFAIKMGKKRKEGKKDFTCNAENPPEILDSEFRIVS